MEDYFRGIKYIANSLASIRTPVPNLELVQLTLNGLDEDYNNLVTTLSYGTNLLTFDDLRSKLIHNEQRLQFLKSKELFQVHHPALALQLLLKNLGKHLNLPTPIVVMGLVVIKIRGTTIIARVIRTKGVAIIILTKISNNMPIGAVSYTHLTLPTKRIV